VTASCGACCALLAAEYEERSGALREAVPGVTLATDMIVGFPGETAQDFEETLALVRVSASR
jgi:tRNA-2-methylthio-N6-dimethylallyladenosine synthase